MKTNRNLKLFPHYKLNFQDICRYLKDIPKREKHLYTDDIVSPVIFSIGFLITQPMYGGLKLIENLMHAGINSYYKSNFYYKKYNNSYKIGSLWEPEAKSKKYTSNISKVLGFSNDTETQKFKSSFQKPNYNFTNIRKYIGAAPKTKNQIVDFINNNITLPAAATLENLSHQLFSTFYSIGKGNGYLISDDGDYESSASYTTSSYTSPSDINNETNKKDSYMAFGGILFKNGRPYGKISSDGKVKENGTGGSYDPVRGFYYGP